MITQLWCLRCHKIRRGRVTMPRSGIQIGICDVCDEKGNKR